MSSSNDNARGKYHLSPYAVLDPVFHWRRVSSGAFFWGDGAVLKAEPLCVVHLILSRGVCILPTTSLHPILSPCTPPHLSP